MVGMRAALAAKGALKITVWRRVGDPVSLPAIVYVDLDERLAGPPAAEVVSFD